MGYYDDYKQEQREKKQRIEKVKQRRVIRYQEVPEEEVRKQGSELLNKIVSAIPKYFNTFGMGPYNRKGNGSVFIKNNHVIRIALALRPSVVVDYVVCAFKSKGWTAEHTFNDMRNYDFLDLSLPEDWLKRVLCIGRYHQKVSEPLKTAQDVYDDVTKELKHNPGI